MFLLTAGDNCYPESGTGDWRGIYSTREEAQALVEEVNHEIQRGKHKVTWKTYKIRGDAYDWYEIIDILKWNKENGFPS